MPVRQLPLSPAAGPAAQTSPEYVQISMASAIALRMRSGRFSRDFEFGGINLLLSYDEGCRSDCGYCGLARTRPGSHEDKSFIRVEWPLVRTDDLVERMARFEPALTRVCISMVTHGRAYRDTCDITRRIAERVRAPISVLVAPPTLKRERLENLRAIGVDMIGVGLDAVTEKLFRCHPHTGSGRWPQVGQVLGGHQRRPGDLRAVEGQRAHPGRARRDRRGPAPPVRRAAGPADLLLPVLLQPGAGLADGRPAAALVAALAPGATGQVPDRVRRLWPGTVRLRRRRRACPPGGGPICRRVSRGGRHGVHDQRLPG